MPAGLSARQLSGVCQSTGSPKDYLGSFMCSHNWQYPSRTYYSVHPATLSTLCVRSLKHKEMQLCLALV